MYFRVCQTATKRQEEKYGLVSVAEQPADRGDCLRAGIFCGVVFCILYCKAPEGSKRISGCDSDTADGIAAHGVRIFFTDCFGPKRPLGKFLAQWGIKFAMTWYGGILAAMVVAFPLMYRTARGAFESFDETLAWSGKTLGLSNTYIFWRVRMPACKQGIIAGTVLAFARALGEYGATSMLIGYTPGRTATISTTVYQLWRTNDEAGAFQWVLVNLAISTLVLLCVNLLEQKNKQGGRKL